VLDTLDGVVAHDTRRIALRAIILRRLGQTAGAQALALDALSQDPLDATLGVLAGRSIGEDAGLLVDVALDFMRAGEADSALEMLGTAIAMPVSAAGNVRPVAQYLAASILDDLGRSADAAARRAAARECDRTWAFPHGLDALDALQRAILAEPDDAVAHSLLGMLLYAHGRRADAMLAWERAVDLGMNDPVLLRNAAVAAYNIAHDDEKAWARYQRAVLLAPDEARLRYEQDQLSSRLGDTAATRLAALRPIESLVLTRDDLTVQYVRLLVAEGEADHAFAILSSRSFHPWEGGEGQVIAAWDATMTAKGMPLTDPPASLGEARSPYSAPAAVREDGSTDYFATSLPDLLLFSREGADD
jgi:tetratricopeptide (TPR) repeat protein